jgi:hypothetical protein
LPAGEEHAIEMQFKLEKYAMRIPAIVLAIGSAGLVAGAASGAATRLALSQLAADPGRYLGHELELARGYCIQADSGYQCSTDGNVWIAARSLAPAAAKRKVDANCGGIDAVERSASCGARIRFTPSSMEKTNTTIDPPNMVLLLNAPEVNLTF